MNVSETIKKKFLNADGTINKSVVASFITLLILLIQEALTIFGIKFTGDWSQIAGAINTVLALLAVAGFVEGNGEVTVTGGDKREVSTQETAHQEVSAPQTKQTGAQGK